MAPPIQYDAFLSYAMRSDYRRARDLETFLESLVDRAGVKDVRPLQICRDGSDFRLPSRRDNAAAQDAVAAIIEDHLARSRKLVVLCSAASTASRWVNHEIRWFLANRGADDILLAVTEGDDPVAAPEPVFAPALMEAGLHRRGIWYDLRGRARDADDERIRLAADLLGWDDATRGPLLAVWQRQEIQRRRRQTWIAVAVAIVVLLLAAAAFLQRQSALRRLADATVTSVRLLTYSGRFDEAHTLLENTDVTDARLDVSAWVTEQQRPYPAAAFDPFRGIFVRRAALDASGRTIVAVSSAGDGQSRLTAADATTMTIAGPPADVAMDIFAISAVHGRPNEFLFVGPRALLSGTFARRWILREHALPREVRGLTLFAGGRRGLAIRGVAVRVVDGALAVDRELARGVTEAQALVASRDATMIGLAELHPETVGIVRVSRVFDSTRELPLDTPFHGRLLGNGYTATLNDDDTLTIRRPGGSFEGRTREIGYKPWVGLASAWGDLVLVQEVGDTDRNPIVKLSFLDAATGRDAVEAVTISEPVAGFAVDGSRSIVVVSQDRGLTRIDTTSPRARTIAFPEPLQPPLRVRGRELFVRTGDAISGTLWAVDLTTLRPRVVAADSVTAFDLAPGSVLLGGLEGLRDARGRVLASEPVLEVAVSPDGDRVLVETATELLLADARTGATLRRFAAKSNLHPVVSLRWLTNDTVLIEDYHGDASLLDVRSGRDRVLPMGDERVTAVSPRGECLITALSGTIRRLQPGGALERTAAIRDVRSLFPLANGIYCGRAEQPSRVAFFLRTEDALEEVAALPTSDALRDAAVVGGKAILVLERSVVSFPLPLPR